MVSRSNWKRGPMPLTAKRDLYVQLMKHGMQNSEACRQVGVNRKTGQRWRLGRVVIDAHNGEHRYDPIIDPPAATTAESARYLSDAERIVIADGLRSGRSKRSIAGELGRSVSSVCREVLRNTDASGEYRPHAAHQRMLTRRPRPKQRRLALNAELRSTVQKRLDTRWSPEQISNSLRLEQPDRPDLQLATESIYRAIYAPASVLTTAARVVLRTGRTNRQRRRSGVRSVRFVVPMTPIKERPETVKDRVEGGPWEGDLITGSMNQSAIGTLVERTSRFTILVHFVGTHDAAQLRDSMTQIFNRLPAGMRRSLTWDQGIEMARHHEFTAATAMPVYFCHHDHRGSGAPTRTPTDFCASTSPRAQTCPSTPPSTFSESLTNSTIDHAKRSDGAPLPPSSIASKSQPCSHDHWYPPRREPHKWGQFRPSFSNQPLGDVTARVMKETETITDCAARKSTPSIELGGGRYRRWHSPCAHRDCCGRRGISTSRRCWSGSGQAWIGGHRSTSWGWTVRTSTTWPIKSWPHCAPAWCRIGGLGSDIVRVAISPPSDGPLGGLCGAGDRASATSRSLKRIVGRTGESHRVDRLAEVVDRRPA